MKRIEQSGSSGGGRDKDRDKDRERERERDSGSAASQGGGDGFMGGSGSGGPDGGDGRSGDPPIPNYRQTFDEPEFTGAYMALVREGSASEGLSQLQRELGIRVASTQEEGVESEEDITSGDGLFLHEIGVVKLPAMEPARAGALADASIEAVEPERIVRILVETDVPNRLAHLSGYTRESDAAAFDDLGITLDETEEGEARALLPETATEYIRGYRDSINALVETLISRTVPRASLLAPTPSLVWNETQFTWGLQATRVHLVARGGRGVRVAVLDTGFGPHADFANRNVRRASFIAGQTPDDGHGHGTHCVGTACGPKVPRTLPRYGVAYESEVFAGKVLSNQGSGTDGSILAGINWAVSNRARVVSMSLGAPVAVGTPFNRVYEGVAQRALARGTLIVAAAGNNRPGPVNHPANCPSIMAVAAVDQQLRPAPFSCRGVNPNGGEVNIAAPGVSVLSCWPRAPHMVRLNGTSMATPHVAGIAALLAQLNPLMPGRALWNALVAGARPLPFPRVDVGAGLVQAR